MAVLRETLVLADVGRRLGHGARCARRGRLRPDRSGTRAPPTPATLAGRQPLQRRGTEVQGAARGIRRLRPHRPQPPPLPPRTPRPRRPTAPPPSHLLFRPGRPAHGARRQGPPRPQTPPLPPRTPRLWRRTTPPAPPPVTSSSTQDGPPRATSSSARDAPPTAPNYPASPTHIPSSSA